MTHGWVLVATSCTKAPNAVTLLVWRVFRSCHLFHQGHNVFLNVCINCEIWWFSFRVGLINFRSIRAAIYRLTVERLDKYCNMKLVNYTQANRITVNKHSLTITHTYLRFVFAFKMAFLWCLLDLFYIIFSIRLYIVLEEVCLFDCHNKQFDVKCPVKTANKCNIC